MANNVDAALDQIEAQQTIELPENGTSLNLLQQVYRNPSLPLPTRMRAAGMALPHEHPKLAVAVMVNAGDFATQLDQAIQRSRTIIEGKPTTMIEHDDTSTAAQRLHAQASNGGKPTIVDRRYRRW